ncbi:MAG: hypothetical protein ABI481_10570 [Pyrinomonadaceae bacterium]
MEVARPDPQTAAVNRRGLDLMMRDTATADPMVASDKMVPDNLLPEGLIEQKAIKKGDPGLAGPMWSKKRSRSRLTRR